MKMIKFILPLFFLLFGMLISCKASEEAVTQVEEIPQDMAEIPVQPMDSDEESFDGESSVVKVKNNDSLFASIVRSPCFGMCPTYKMWIYNDGSVVLEANRAVRLEGSFTAQISEKQMKEFTDVAQSIEFMKLQNKYDSPITDIPSTTLTIVMEGQRKEVYASANYPQRIKQYAKLFDDLLEADIWTEAR